VYFFNSDRHATIRDVGDNEDVVMDLQLLLDRGMIKPASDSMPKPTPLANIALSIGLQYGHTLADIERSVLHLIKGDPKVVYDDVDKGVFVLISNYYYNNDKAFKKYVDDDELITKYDEYVEITHPHATCSNEVGEYKAEYGKLIKYLTIQMKNLLEA